MARSSRIILKDYAAGRLLFSFPPKDGQVEEKYVDEEMNNIRTAEGVDAILSTREAAVAEEDSAFDVELLNAMRFEDDENEKDVLRTGRDRVSKSKHMTNSSNAITRRRAAKQGKGKGKGRRGRHGRDQTPYEDDVSLLNDFTFVKDDEGGSGGIKKKGNRRRRRGEKSGKNKSRKNGVTFQKPF
jgi:hypothetical protein